MDTKRQILSLKRSTTSAAAKPSANTTTAEKTAHVGAGTKRSRHNRKKLELLLTHWPAAFSLDAPRPFAVGTTELIAADMCSRDIAGAGTKNSLSYEQQDHNKGWICA